MALDERQQKLVDQNKQMENRKEYARLTAEIEDLREALEKLRKLPDTDSERNRHTKNVVMRSLASKVRQRDMLD